jgi:hypothetical protein
MNLAIEMLTKLWYLLLLVIAIEVLEVFRQKIKDYFGKK